MLWAFDALLKGLAVLAAGLFSLIAVVIAINVALRNLGFPVIYGALDAIQYTIMAATFLGAPWVLAQGGHVQVDLVTSALPEAARRMLARAACVVGMLTAGVLCWHGVKVVAASVARDAMVRTSFVIPEWWTLIFVPVSMALCALVFLRKLIAPETAPRSLSGL